MAWSGDWNTQYSELRIYNQGIPLLHILHTSTYSFTKVALIVRQYIIICYTFIQLITLLSTISVASVQDPS